MIFSPYKNLIQDKETGNFLSQTLKRKFRVGLFLVSGIFISKWKTRKLSS